MEKLEIKKRLLEIGDDALRISIESLSKRYRVPIRELEDIATMSRLAGRMEESLELEEMLLNGLEEMEED